MLFIFLALPIIFAEAHHVRGEGFTKLFVFGDSYVDTGNSGRQATSWKKPYGITFPGKPSGRYSDGRVFTDYIGQSLSQFILISHLNFSIFYQRNLIIFVETCAYFVSSIGQASYVKS